MSETKLRAAARALLSDWYSDPLTSTYGWALNASIEALRSALAESEKEPKAEYYGTAYGTGTVSAYRPAGKGWHCGHCGSTDGKETEAGWGCNACGENS